MHTPVARRQYPETIALVLWGTDNIKTYGESLAQVGRARRGGQYAAVLIAIIPAGRCRRRASGWPSGLPRHACQCARRIEHIVDKLSMPSTANTIARATSGADDGRHQAGARRAWPRQQARGHDARGERVWESYPGTLRAQPLRPTPHFCPTGAHGLDPQEVSPMLRHGGPLGGASCSGRFPAQTIASPRLLPRRSSGGPFLVLVTLNPSPVTLVNPVDPITEPVGAWAAPHRRRRQLLGRLPRPLRQPGVGPRPCVWRRCACGYRVLCTVYCVSHRGPRGQGVTESAGTRKLTLLCAAREP